MLHNTSFEINMAQTPFYNFTFIILFISQHLKIYFNLDKPAERNTKENISIIINIAKNNITRTREVKPKMPPTNLE